METRQAEAPRVVAPRAEAPRVVAPRAEAPRAVAPSVDSRRYEGNREVYSRAVPRAQVIAPRVERPAVVAPRAYAAPRVYAPSYRSYYGGYYGFRPGFRPYAFRPYTRLSFGIFLGYPVPYAYSYPYPVPVYGYGAPSAPVYITPSSTLYGGVALQITPDEAQVFVDGQYVGTVRDFDGVSGPLNLTAGRHHLELTAPDYEPLALDIDVAPGQLTPYRGDMQPARY
jgi:hypothetical protein